MSLIPIKDNNSLYRDPYSGAVVNCSSLEYQSYIQDKNREIEKNQEIDQLKSDVNEIKDMMKLILSKLDSGS